jgi:transcriptional activator of cad operon
MDRLTTIPLRIGDWRLDPQLGQLSRGERVERLEARTLRLLQYLANRAGETVSIEELLDNVWSGVVVTQDSVYQAVTALRRLLGDDAKSPSYIATVPRLGYRLVASVSAWTDEPLDLPPVASPPRSRSLLWPAVFAVAVVLAAVFGWRLWSAPAPKSVAVLPFLDLTTQEMKEEYFADGLTEELINRLSKLPAFEVPSASASFHFKDQGLPPDEIADRLRVRYLLDGSLRESGDTLRISARLVRARDGFVIWTENYDRPKADRVMIQDDIAGKVAAALAESVR